MSNCQWLSVYYALFVAPGCVLASIFGFFMYGLRGGTIAFVMFAFWGTVVLVAIQAGVI